jgi:hypothetical protein
MRIQARLREMASNEIAAMIEPDRLREIRAHDPHPLFKAFVVGHEGEAKGYVVGLGNTVKRWFRQAIEMLTRKISVGLQLFHGHGETNDNAGRQAIGEVVGKRGMKIGDRLSAVVACYIYPSFRHLPLDVASIEAEVALEEDARRGLYVAEVERVTGIALANSAIEKPGFAGATLLGQLQAFARSKDIGDNLMDLTLEDVRAFLKTEKVKPSDIFPMEEMAADPVVRGLAEDRVKERIAGEFARRKEAEEKLEKIEKGAADKESAFTRQITDLRIAAAKSQVGPMFEKQRTSRKLDDRQTKFIQNRLARFTPSKPEDIDKEFEAYLDAEVDEYGKIAREVFGIEDKKVEPPANGGDKGTGPDKGKPTGGPENKYLDPAQNPMIKLA